MTEAKGEAEAEKPKKHSPFIQVILRKSGEAFDLAGKSIVGFGSLGSALHARAVTEVDWSRLLWALVLGGVVLALGIYLQAAAEET